MTINLANMAKKHNELQAKSWRAIYLEVAKQHPELAKWEISLKVKALLESNRS